MYSEIKMIVPEFPLKYTQLHYYHCIGQFNLQFFCGFHEPEMKGPI